MNACKRCGNAKPVYLASTEEGECCDKCHSSLPGPRPKPGETGSDPKLVGTLDHLGDYEQAVQMSIYKG